MNKEQQGLLGEAYKNYTQTKVIKTENGETHISPQGHYSNLSQEEFINKCKTNPHLYEKEVTYSIPIYENGVKKEWSVDGIVGDKKYQQLISMSPEGKLPDMINTTITKI
jgi:hypothetical protein